LCEAVFFVGLFRDERLLVMFVASFSIDSQARLSRPFFQRCVTDADEARFLEERVDPSHLGLGFDPRARCELATPPHELRGNARSAISGMEHHARENEQLSIEGFCFQSRRLSSQSEKPVSLRKRLRARTENANADRIVAVPQ